MKHPLAESGNVSSDFHSLYLLMDFSQSVFLDGFSQSVLLDGVSQSVFLDGVCQILIHFLLDLRLRPHTPGN